MNFVKFIEPVLSLNAQRVQLRPEEKTRIEGAGGHLLQCLSRVFIAALWQGGKEVKPALIVFLLSVVHVCLFISAGEKLRHSAAVTVSRQKVGAGRGGRRDQSARLQMDATEPIPRASDGRQFGDGNTLLCELATA